MPIFPRVTPNPNKTPIASDRCGQIKQTRSDHDRHVTVTWSCRSRQLAEQSTNSWVITSSNYGFRGWFRESARCPVDSGWRWWIASRSWPHGGSEQINSSPFVPQRALACPARWLIDLGLSCGNRAIVGATLVSRDLEMSLNLHNRVIDVTCTCLFISRGEVTFAYFCLKFVVGEFMLFKKYFRHHHNLSNHVLRSFGIWNLILVSAENNTIT